MSKFGDLINGSNTPEPIKDYEVTITGIDESPVVEEESKAVPLRAANLHP